MVTVCSPAPRPICRAVVFIEDWVFPLIFLYFAFLHLSVLFAFRHQILAKASGFWLDGLDRGDLDFLMSVLFRVLLAVLNVGCAAGLAMREKRAHFFSDWREIAIPLLSTTWSWFANLVVYSHARINIQLIPQPLATALSSTGLCLVAVGAAISVLGVWNLRRSFAIFVERQPVVDTGLYSVVRHPIYVGHALRMVGYCVMDGFLFYILVTLGAMALLVYRARLEERKLELYEPGYADYKRRSKGLTFAAN